MAVTLCPIAIAVGCRKCPIFKVCPLKGVIGDQRSAPEAPSEHAAGSGGKRPPGSAPPKPKSKPKRKGSRPRRRER